MHYRHLTIHGVAVTFTNVPGAGHTRVEIAGHPALSFDPARKEFAHFAGHSRTVVEPELSAAFKDELLLQLEVHDAVRRENIRRRFTIRRLPRADGRFDVETPLAVNSQQSHWLRITHDDEHPDRMILTLLQVATTPDSEAAVLDDGKTVCKLLTDRDHLSLLRHQLQVALDYRQH